MTMDHAILQLFVDEAAEHVAAINEALLCAERKGSNDAGALARALRHAHTLKGAAAAAGVGVVSHLVHNWEACAGAVAQGGVAGAAPFGLLFSLLDLIAQEANNAAAETPRLELDRDEVCREVAACFGAACELKPIEAGPQAAAGEGSHGADEAGSVRVPVQKLERQLAKVEELTQLRAGGEHGVRRARDLATLVERLNGGLAAARNRLRALAAPGGADDALAEAARLGGDATILAGALLGELLRHSRDFEALSGRLQDDMRTLRMFPVGQAFTPFRRMVRDLAHAQGKQVNLVIEGGETEVDRDLLEILKDPVMHVLRNAVDHGIESPAERVAAGKAPEARICLRAAGRAGSLVLRLSDDGRGISLDRVRQAAVRRGVVRPEVAAQLDDGDVRNLIFVHGFSTAETVTEVSGRGIGLDVVKDAVEELGGRITVRSTVGAGTEFELVLPLSLATMRLLLLRVGPETYAVPVSAVDRVLRIGAADVRRVDHGEAVEIEGRPVPVLRLADALGSASEEDESDRRPAILLSSFGVHAAIVVTQILGEQELLVKTLGSQLEGLTKVSGATVLGNGDIVPIINPAEVLREASRGSARAALFTDRRTDAVIARRIMVVDDSITTRTLEKSILESVGYSVEIATDGVDALEKLRQAPFDLVLSDVQMPRMGGLELVRTLKGTEQLRDLPVILVSSLGGQEDRKGGLDAGANAYICKSEFQQELLLETIERLL